MNKNWFALILINIFAFDHLHAKIGGTFLSNTQKSVVQKKTSAKKNFIYINNKEKDIKGFYKGVSFKTENGLNVRYFGGRYSKKFLLDFLKGCNSKPDELAKLRLLGFDNIDVTAEDALEITDAFNLEEISFCVTYRDDNQIKRKIYNKDSNSLTSYYSSYLAQSGLSLKNQKVKPICLKDIKLSLERLRLHFFRLGYKYIDIGYDLVQNPISGHLNLIYSIDLDGVQRNTIEFIGGDPVINTTLRKSYPKYQFTLCEAANNYVYISQFMQMVLARYHDEGYLDVKVSSYFDDAEKKIVYVIKPGSKFVIEDYQLENHTVGYALSPKKQKVIDTMLAPGSFYTLRKIKEVKKILVGYYGPDVEAVEHSLYEDKVYNQVSIIFSFKMKKMYPKRVLKKIKCTGNIRVPYYQITNLLNIKIGDLISSNDISHLKWDLEKTRWFNSVNLYLDVVGDSNELIVEVQEVPIFIESPTLNLSSGEGSSAVSFGAGSVIKNVLNGKNLQGSAQLNWSSDAYKKNALVLDLASHLFLPNGKCCEIGGFIYFQPNKIKDGPLLYDQEAGFNAGLYMDTEFYRRHRLTLAYKDSKKEGIPYFSLKTYLFNSSSRSYDHFLHTSVTNEVIAKLDYKNSSVLDKLLANMIFRRYLSEDRRLNLQLALRGGVMLTRHVDSEKDFSRYFLFQYIPDFHLGFWGPTDTKRCIAVGGLFYLGCQAQFAYRLNFDLLPDLLNSSWLYTRLEFGSIFNRKKAKTEISEYSRGAASIGLTVPISSFQIDIFYLIPLWKESGDFGSDFKQGWSFNVACNFDNL